MKIVNTDEVPYENIKSNKKAGLYPLSRKFSFWKKNPAF